MNNRLATIGLVAFLAVDVALVALALRPGRLPAEPQPLATTVPATTPASTGTGTGTPDPTTSSSAATVAPNTVPVALMVSALDARTAWRARSGSCTAGGSAVALTTDGGGTWTSVRSPARALARVQVLDRNRAFAVGAGTDCGLRQYATTDQGQTWQAPSGVQNGWSRHLDKPNEVLTPNDDHATPCDTQVVVDLARTSSTQAEALCADGTVKLTSDGGSTWTDSGTAPGAVALGNLLRGSVLTTYAVRIVGACDGLQVVRVTKGEAPGVVACVPAAAPKRGQVGLSVTANGSWIVSGTETWLSDTALRSWKQA
jgi:hypothetical protein